MSPLQPSDRELLDDAISGHPYAFAALFDRHHRAVYWQAYGVVRHANDAQDITQDVFVTAWRRRTEIRVEDSLLPGLLVTARNTALNASRKRARLHAVPLVDEADSLGVEDQVEAKAVRDAVERAVAVLSPIERELFTRCIDGDETYEDAATALGLTHGGVRNRVSRLRGRLRADLRDLKEDA